MRIARLSLMVLILALAPTWRGTTSDAAAIADRSPPRGSSLAPLPVDAALGQPKGPATVEQLKRRGITRARPWVFALAITTPLILGARMLWMLVGRPGPDVKAHRAPVPSGRSPPRLQAI
jgi:hypothetical protein